MTNKFLTHETKIPPRYVRVSIASVDGHRRGKHNDLVGSIIRELQTITDKTAMKIPLADIGGVELANLRSALHRAAKSKKIVIETSSDAENLYLWKAEDNGSAHSTATQLKI
jgi:hypothetical protein